MSGTPTPRQHDLMRHALGHYQTPAVQRNYFATTPDTADDLDWQALVTAGHARLFRPAAGDQSLNYYSVTPAGQLLVSQGARFARTDA